MSSNNNTMNDDSYNENTCVVCFKNVDIFSIGDCDHPVCYECSTRMRVLCLQNECPICRHDMKKVIFTKCVQPFKQLNEQIGTKYLKDQTFKIAFESADDKEAYDLLLAHVCSECPDRHAFQTFAKLRDHMRKEHELFYCDLCVDNLKILTHERRCYTRKDLAIHRRQGDADNRSHRGHPICEFCNDRYMDNDELYRHLRRDHLFCHFCDIDGLHQYYISYDFLREHFRERHYLCEEGECYHEKFTSAFRTEIDLKAHRASVHGRQMTKAAAKQARTLELAFTLKPRPYQGDQRRGGGGRNPTRYCSEEEEGAVGGTSAPQYQRTSQQVTSTPTFSKINTASNDEFPSLSGGGSAPLAQGVHFRKPGVTIRAGGSLAMTEEDFPALGPEATASVSLRVNSVGRSSVNGGSRVGSGSAKPTNVSIHVNTRPSSRKDPFPALGATSSAQTPLWSAARDPVSQAHHISSAKSRASQPAPKSSHSKTAKSFRFDDEDFPVNNDFPTLGGNVPSHIASLASSQWSSGREPEPKVSVNKNKTNQPPPKPPQPKTFHIEDDFPSLSNKFNTNCNVTQKSKPLQPKPPEANPKKGSSISISVDNDWAKSVKNTVSNDVSSDSDIGSKKSSKKKQKKSNAKIESTPQQSKSNQGKNTNSIVNYNNNNEVPKKGKDAKTKTKQSKVGEESINQSVEKHKSNETMERKRSELKIESLNGQDNRDSAVNINDFPSLGNNRLPPGLVREKTPAPPGFETPAGLTVPPPPGFSIILNSVARPASNNLTFTSSSGQNYPISPATGSVASIGDGGGRVYEYVAPQNCKSRNGELVRNVAEALASPDMMEQFLAWSSEFRHGSLSADGYYQNCREIMGPAFQQLFPELIVLLPDITKQQELWKVSEQLGEWRLNVCAACGQVVAGADFKSHHATHSLDNHFPSLANGVAGPNAWHK